jgi:RNA polymerase sigma-70 factor (ECF subfamily)
MDSDIDLQFLMARYQQGDSGAATALVNRLSPQLYRFFLMQFVSRRHAEDLLQETWLRIHQVRHTYRNGQPLLPWLYAIARNIRVDHYRRAHRAEGREERLEEGSDLATAPDDRQARNPDLDALLSAM